MKKLLLKILILVSTVFLMLCLLIIAPFPAIDSMSMYQQKHKLCQNVSGKKIIFVGGSGVLYSVDAKLLESQNTGYHIINMGLSAGLGLKFNLNEIKPYINSGDLVVLIPEHINFQNGPHGSVATLLAINSVPKTFITTPWEHLKYLLYSFGLEFIPTKCQNYVNDFVLYVTKSAPSMSHNGDIITHTSVRDVSKMPLTCGVEYEKNSYKDTVALLEEFNNYCIKREAYAMFAFSAIPAPQYEKNKSQLASLYSNLSNDIKIPILSKPEHYVYPSSFFDDTVYHMNMKSKAVNSLKLLGHMKDLYPELIR